MLWRASLMAKSKQNEFVAALCSFSSILGAETASSRITSRLVLLLDLKHVASGVVVDLGLVRKETRCLLD